MPRCRPGLRWRLGVGALEHLDGARAWCGGRSQACASRLRDTKSLLREVEDDRVPLQEDVAKHPKVTCCCPNGVPRPAAPTGQQPAGRTDTCARTGQVVCAQLLPIWASGSGRLPQDLPPCIPHHLSLTPGTVTQDLNDRLRDNAIAGHSTATARICHPWEQVQRICQIAKGCQVLKQSLDGVWQRHCLEWSLAVVHCHSRQPTDDGPRCKGHEEWPTQRHSKWPCFAHMAWTQERCAKEAEGVVRLAGDWPLLHLQHTHVPRSCLLEEILRRNLEVVALANLICQLNLHPHQVFISHRTVADHYVPSLAVHATMLVEPRHQLPHEGHVLARRHEEKRRAGFDHCLRPLACYPGGDDPRCVRLQYG
mmetsp:Transcript_94773/g.305956  ORF Transcript_94773/g.305956 Transcript_94773/m.305956 type:complete len:366 (-) Transcript_94773:741-1838(-)